MGFNSRFKWLSNPTKSL